LLLAVVGSGIMAERLAEGNTAIALLANAIATGGALVALIHTFGPISGAHFNPVVTLAIAWRDRLPRNEIILYLLAQFSGAWCGVIAAHFIFSTPLFELSTKVRSGIPLMTSEFIATFGLLAVILVGDRTRPESVPFSVAAYITGAYWFTSSTSFANPAVTFARMFTDSFAGIQAADVPFFMLAQLAGMTVAFFCFSWLLGARNETVK
ncbi:MAG TPA: aquaporin, partial [Dongiaceae bacterium]|nr:aquaporin [Dongiaceae bacterium]